MNQAEILKSWQRFCDAQGLQKEAQAARLGVNWIDYHFMLQGKRDYTDSILAKMVKIIEGRDLLDRAVLPTGLYKTLESHIRRCLNDKLMITLAAPTGQGKSICAKALARKYDAKYFPVLSDLQKRRVASIRGFIRDLGRSYNVKERSRNPLRHLIEKMQSDTRSLLILDESQRLISEDWGYFKVLQDLIDNVPNLSIILLGNYRFYSDVFTDSRITYTGVTDQEQFLRRLSVVEKLPRLNHHDVKIWCDYNNIKMKPADYKHLAEFFAYRAALSDLENVRKELIRIMGKGKIKTWKDVNADVMIAVYKKIHTEIIEIEEGTDEAESFNADKNAA